MSRNFKILLVGFFFSAAGAIAMTQIGADDTQRIHWQRDLYAAHDISVASGKPMLIVFGTEWCNHCRKLERSTLADPRIVTYLNGAFVPVHLNLDRNKEIARILEVESIPCAVVLSPEADLLGRLVGYMNADTYHHTLERSRQLQARVRQAKATRNAR